MSQATRSSTGAGTVGDDLNIRRYFTTEGVHPYDEIEWELRDAIIQNFRTGEVAFEQKEIEVPKSWSQNATNIASQKYFRGTQGTPDRERSIKQMIDRVVDVYHREGAARGYFVDDDEAQVFKDELTHLLVTQKAAFNSPVWFNVGWREKPQVSACQPYDSLVSTPAGLIPIGKLVEENAVGTKVFDAEGLTKVVATKANGTKEVFRITTKAGYTLDVTADHLVWKARRGGGGRFVPAGQLEPGDALEWYRQESFDQDEAESREGIESSGPGEPHMKQLQIASIESLGDMPVYDIQTESGEYLSGNLRVHNCFILAVEDEMSSILNWYVEEGTIFKHGSGSGINLSTIRSSKERLKSGGTASGPVSFMRGADASAGTIKSGGATRRAAKMVVLNVDHPDIKDFIWCKALEERKARALGEAGFDMDLDGRDSHSIQYQNANNSVRVTDEFMQAVVDDKDWNLKAVTNGETLETLKAKELLREISEAAWQCADPGMQYDTTINDWHTCPNSGPITASNPCFTGDTRVHTDKGQVRFDDMMRRVIDGETFDVYTHDITNADSPQDSMRLSKPTQFMTTGVNEIVRLRFRDGRELRCTPNHRVWTENRGWVRADELVEEDRVKTLDHPTPATMANYELPVSTNVADYASKYDKNLKLNLPEKWTEEFAYYLGWLVGDGCISKDGTISTIYGSSEDQEEVMPRHLEFITPILGGRSPKPSIQENGTMQLRVNRRPFRLFLQALGLKAVPAREKEVPWSIFEAPDDIAAAFLRGLFDADGCAVTSTTSWYAGLGGKCHELLRGVQMLLARLGITGRIYETTRNAGGFTYTRKDGSVANYESYGPSYDLRIGGKPLGLFFGLVGFDLERKLFGLERMVADHRRKWNKGFSSLAKRDFDGFELTYNLTEPVNHSYVSNGVIVANCSEYVHVDNSSCNLSSINLLKFVDDDDHFDVEAYKHAVEVMFLAQEISVGFAAYPTEKIGENSHRFRQLGQGYANLGALLMSQGLAYDSDAGRGWAAAITSMMTGHCYATSAKIAKRVGAFDAYEDNKEPMLRVMNKHRDAAYEIPQEDVPDDMWDAARSSWDEALTLGLEHGYRNAQATVLAPTGTIGLLMDCDTTGIEPDLALKKMKKLVGGGTMAIVNQTVPRALRKLGHDDSQVMDIVSYIDENSHVVGAPHLREEHLSVFDTAMGERTIHYMGHIKMMSAVQPFLSGAISKTVNLPEDVTVEDVEQAYIEGWSRGLKALALYRDNCKVAQPLSLDKKEKKADPTEAAKALVDAAATDLPEPVRRRLPKRRNSKTFKFRVADTEGYITSGEFADGSAGEIFLRVAKQGSTLAGIMDAFAISISMGLQYGVPLSAYVKQFTNTRFEPSGMTDDPDFRIATSILDYVFRLLALEYLDIEERHSLGIRTSGERQNEIESKLGPSPKNEESENGNGNGHGNGNGGAKAETGDQVLVLGPVASVNTGSLPFCGTCGVQMQPAGSCFACPSCGSTSGCS